MKNQILVAIVLLVTLLTTVSCAGVDVRKPDNPAPSTAEISFLNYDELMQNPHIQKQINITKGDEVLVELLSNASTGFSWNENAVIADTSVVQQVKHEKIASGNNIPGAPGSEKWTFKALKAAATTVHLEYGRPWQGGEKGVWTLDLAITVK